MSSTVPTGARTRRRRRAPLAVVAALGVAFTLTTVPTAAPAEAAVNVTVTGRGYGHGHGLSQYGAKGRAEAGQGYASILSAYYPGTTRATASDTSRTIRVWVQGDNDGIVTVRREPVMSVATTGRAMLLPTTVGGQTPTHWRVRLVGSALTLEAQVGSRWVANGDATITAALAGADQAVLGSSDKSLQLVLGSTYREYLGTVTAARVPSGSSHVVRTVVTSTVRDYLRSVVPSEMPAGWHLEALKAQAVAARTYATFDMQSVGPAWYDTCDTTSCQVYYGYADYDAAGNRTAIRENARTTQAIDATAGVLVMYGGKAAFTQFSASNGGHSAAGSQPYLRAAADPLDQYPAWSVTLTDAQVRAKYPTIGAFTTLAVTARDGRGPYGGRATSVRITGTAGSVTVTGAQFRTAFGLRSTLFATAVSGTPVVAPQRDWNGDGGPDLLGRAPSGKLNFYPGLPNATWGRAAQIGQGWGSMRLMTQVHGFTGVTRPEIVTTNAQGILFLYPGDGRGGWAPPMRLGQGWWGFDQLVGVQGWHGGTKPALLARKAATGQVLVYEGDGRGSFGNVRDLGTGWNQYDTILAAGDWDGDGHADLMGRVKATGALVLIRGNSTGRVAGTVQIGRGWAGMDEIVGAADWDRDGRYDVIAREDGTGRLWLYPGDGAGGFLERRQIGHGWTGFALVK